MNILPVGLLLLSLTAYGSCNNNQPDIDLFSHGNDRSVLQQRGMFRIPNLFDILKKFQLCKLTCNGKVCSCCQNINLLVTNMPVCISSNLNALGGILEIGISVASQRIVSTKVNVGTVIHSCHSFKTTLGNLEVCLDAALNERNNSPNAFTLKSTVWVNYNNIKAVRVDINTVNFQGDVHIDGELINGAKSFGSVVVLNAAALATELMKHVAKGIVG